MTAQPKVKLLRYEWVWLGAVALPGCYLMGYFRSWCFGLSIIWWRVLLAEAIFCAFFIVPITLLSIINLPDRTVVKGVLAMFFGCIIAVESFMCAQEVWVICKYGWNPGKEVHLSRWAPYANSRIFYAPGYGWCGDD